ncbi:MAG: S-layer homology domain-containing protein [Clostridia bacterium]|nr:S-layer homology domain-containing protein [Clostridia bacterium]
MMKQGLPPKVKKLTKKILIPSICVAFVLCAIAVGVVLTRHTAAESPMLSVGLQQLADERYLACSAVVGKDITFDEGWFDAAMGCGTVTAVTVVELPPVVDGVLRLGYGEVAVGQSIPRETLSYLTFTPADGVKSSSFSFVPHTSDGEVGYALTCALRVTESVNCCPVGNKSVLAVSTHETLVLAGTLQAEDADGDALYYEICSYPTNGSVSLDTVTGKFVYEPAEGYHGEDSFTWRAQDENGGYSEPATIQVTVRELGEGYTFADMEGHTNHTHALRVSEKGLLSGEKMGGKHYFHPERALTRAAFVTVLLKAAEIEAPHCEHTVFADDADIPAPMRGAVQYALDKGYLEKTDNFRPNDAITRAEAAAIAAKVLSLSAPGYYETVGDFSAIPIGVADALYAIYEGGYISTMEGGVLAPQGVLTRGDAAAFFARVLDEKGE